MSLINFYNEAKKYIIREGYGWEIEYTEERKFEDQTAEDFYRAFVFVVCNSGMKNQVAEKIFRRFWESQDLQFIGHPHKRKAIKEVMERKEKYFEYLKKQEDKLKFLEALPHIGKITKYHLARNLGMDFAKPDRHLVRLAEIFKKADVQEMCRELSEQTGDRIGTVDVVLWRYCNLVPKCFDSINICENSCVGRDDHYCDDDICKFVDGDVDG